MAKEAALNGDELLRKLVAKSRGVNVMGEELCVLCGYPARIGCGRGCLMPEIRRYVASLAPAGPERPR